MYPSGPRNDSSAACWKCRFDAILTLASFGKFYLISSSMCDLLYARYQRRHPVIKWNLEKPFRTITGESPATFPIPVNFSS